MINTLSKPYIKYPLLALYLAVMGFTTGIGLLQGLPMLGFVPGPFLSYGMGLLLGCAVVLIFFRWHAPRRTKLLIAALLLIVLAAAGLLVASQGIIEGNERVIELLGNW